MDPSGYGWLSDAWKKVKKTFGNSIVRTVVAIAASVVTFGYAGLLTSSPFWGAVAGGFVGGTIVTGTLKGGVIGAFTAGAFYGVGSWAGAWHWSAKTLVHGVIGGTSSVASGGRFESGFMSAGFTQFASPTIGRVSGDTVGRTVAAAVIGGTAAELGGGKFANGATTAAFSYLFSNAAASSMGPKGRALTADEISAAESVFGDTIDYSQVRVIDGKFVPWQGEGYVIAPDGNIYWPGECGNLAVCNGGASAGTFIHETTHVLQVQHGVNVLGRGLLLQAGKFLSFGLYDPYKFSYDPNRSFSSYNIEQQGDIARGIYYGRYPNNIDY